MSDDDLPPLLDETELVEKIINRKTKRSKTRQTSNELLELEKGDYIPDLIKSEIAPAKKEVSKPKAKTAPEKTNKKSGFGGFQTGFLSGKTSKPKSQPKTVQEDEIEEIITPKAREQLKRDNPLVLPEVQEQMKKELADDKFLSSYENNEKLMRQMADPKFARAIEFMQKDPSGCKAYYEKNDPKFFAELVEFFQENMKRMGAHMEKRGGEQVVSDDERRMQEIMKRPEVARALADPEIQRLLNELRNDPNRAQQKLSRLKPAAKAHIDVLVRNGLLQIQR